MRISVMSRQEVDIAIDWAGAEGWNPGLFDADCFYAADPNGFLMGWLDDEPIATISAVRYGESFGFIGFYIVQSDYRGQGYGMQIWNAALAYLSDRTIGLDGVVAQQENYAKSGFTLAYHNIRYQGMGGGVFPTNSAIVPLSTLPFELVCDYDRPFFPDRRTEFLRCWINQPQSTALGILNQQQLAGYGVIRPCQVGYKIGPLLADNLEFAEQLLRALKAKVPEGSSIFLDIPDGNSAAIELVQRHNMLTVFETARMYLGTHPNLPLDRLFGVTTFELG
jgi:GNAT superfamily N-acetyltransferase